MPFLDLETMLINFLLAPFTAPALERELRLEKTGHAADRAAWAAERERLTDEINKLKSEIEVERTKRAESRTKYGAEHLRMNSEIARLEQELSVERAECGRLRVALERSDGACAAITTERGQLMGENVRLRSELEERKQEHREEIAKVHADLGEEKVLRATEIARLTKALEDERRAREEEELMEADEVHVVQSTTEARVVPLDESPITYKELRHLAASLQEERNRRIEDVVQIQRLLEEERTRFAREIAQLTTKAAASSSIHKAHNVPVRRGSKRSKSTVELADPNGGT